MIQINSSDLLDEAFASDAALIFKHSNSCPTSFRAHRQVKTFEAAHPEVQLYFVDVIRHREYSQEIARRLNLRHESPQIILVEDSKLVWDASHSAVTSAALEEAINLSKQEQ